MKLIKIHRLRFDIDDHNTKIKKGQVSLDCDNDHAFDMPNVSRYNDDLKKAIQKALGPNEVKSLNNIRTLYRYPNLSLSRDKVAFYCQNNDLHVKHCEVMVNVYSTDGATRNFSFSIKASINAHVLHPGACI